MKLFKFFLVASFVLSPMISVAQVGIGLTNPSAQLEIATTGSGIPALRLKPQLNPNGTAGGQIAFIGSRPYLYDTSRSKWLGLELTGFQFNQGETRSSDGGTVRYGGNQQSTVAGPRMPLNGTIVYATAKVVNGNQSKQFNILIKNASNDVVATQSITLASGQSTRIDLNTNFSAGNYMILEASGDGPEVHDVSFIVWVKWRP